MMKFQIHENLHVKLTRSFSDPFYLGSIGHILAGKRLWGSPDTWHFVSAYKFARIEIMIQQKNMELYRLNIKLLGLDIFFSSAEV